MPVDSRTFKDGMRRLAAGVTLVTTHGPQGRGGLTATAVCSLSADPPRLLACVNHSASCHDAIAASERFCVNVLALTHQALARRFADPTIRGEERFAEGHWTTFATGAPVLADALVAFDCRVADRLQSGTHTVFIGDVAAIHAGPDAPPLLYMDGGFSTLALAG